jgi:uncharacterized protein YxjI
MTGPGEPAAGWYPDPLGRYELRYWDGRAWTAHVSTRGQTGMDEPTGTPAVPTVQRSAEKIRRDVARAGAGAAPATGGGTVLTETVLVVNQKAKVFELTNEYAVFDRDANQIGAVRQVGQSTARKALRMLTSLDQYLTHRLEIVDMQGRVVLRLTRPAKLLKSRVVVEDGTGRELGQIVQQNVIGKIRFSLEAGGQAYGSINAENWRAWNFNIQDQAGTEVARITKTWEGLAKTLFTTADNYVVHIHRPLEDPLRSLVVAASLAVDTALKQDARGLG